MANVDQITINLMIEVQVTIKVGLHMEVKAILVTDQDELLVFCATNSITRRWTAKVYGCSNGTG